MELMKKLYHVKRARKLIKSAFHETRLTDKDAWIPIYECLERVEARCNQLEDEFKKSKGIRSKVDG